MMNPNDASLARMLQGMGGEELQGLGLQGASAGGGEIAEPQLNPAMMEMLMAQAQQNPDIGAKIHQLLQQMNQGANNAAQGAMGAVKQGAGAVADWATKGDKPVRRIGEPKPKTARYPDSPTRGKDRRE